MLLDRRFAFRARLCSFAIRSRVLLGFAFCLFLHIDPMAIIVLRTSHTLVPGHAMNKAGPEPAVATGHHGVYVAVFVNLATVARW